MSPSTVAWVQSGSAVMLNPLQKGVVLRGEKRRGRVGAPGRGVEPGPGQVDPEAGVVFVASFQLQPAASLLECWGRISRARGVCCA